MPLTFAISVALDQIVKFWIRSNFVEAQSKTLIPGVIDWTLTYNRGIAFGMFQGAGVLLAPIAVAIALGAIHYSYRNPKEHPSLHFAMAMLAAGAVGNLYDRVVLGKVTDMFALRFIEFPVFNVADVCITVAGAILVVRWTIEAFAPKRATSEPPSTTSETSAAPAE